MKWELSDENLLLVSGVACAAYASHAVVAPRNLHEVYMEKDQLCNEAMARWFGVALGCNASQQIVLSASEPNKKTVKNALKAVGAGWLAASALTAWNAQEGIEKKEVAIPTAAGQAAMAALCLWRGFDDNGNDKDGL